MDEGGDADDPEAADSAPAPKKKFEEGWPVEALAEEDPQEDTEKAMSTDDPAEGAETDA